MINVLSLDGGLATFGAVIVQTNGREHRAVRAGVFTSEQKVTDEIYMSDDYVRRARELDVWLDAFTLGIDIQIVAAESMGFAKHAKQIICMSLAWGVISSFLASRRLRLVSASASYWRTKLLNEPPVRGGTKAQREARTKDRERRAHAVAVRTVPSLVKLLNGIKPGEQLHALDAGGVFCWSVTHPDVQEVALR